MLSKHFFSRKRERGKSKVAKECVRLRQEEASRVWTHFIR